MQSNEDMWGKLLGGLIGWQTKVPASIEVTYRRVDLNGAPGLVVCTGGLIDRAVVFDIRDGQISALRVIRNPDKLQHLSRSTPSSHPLRTALVGPSHPPQTLFSPAALPNFDTTILLAGGSGITFSLSIALAWVAHYDEEIFPDAKAFRPERWIEAENDPERLKVMSDMYMPVGLTSMIASPRQMTLISNSLVLGPERVLGNTSQSSKCPS